LWLLDPLHGDAARALYRRLDLQDPLLAPPVLRKPGTVTQADFTRAYCGILFVAVGQRLRLTGI
jgi:hypothetical protein